MTDYSVHHPAQGGISHDHDAMSGNSYDPHFDEVMCQVKDHHQLNGYVDGPLEAHMEARDRLSMRLHQASALVEMLKDAHTRDRFSMMCESLQSYYFHAISDLIGAASIDGEVAIDEAKRGR